MEVRGTTPAIVEYFSAFVWTRVEGVRRAGDQLVLRHGTRLRENVRGTKQKLKPQNYTILLLFTPFSKRPLFYSVVKPQEPKILLESLLCLFSDNTSWEQIRTLLQSHIARNRDVLSYPRARGELSSRKRVTRGKKGPGDVESTMIVTQGDRC